MRPIVYVDLETTGLTAGKHEIWECGALKVTPGVHDETMQEETHWFVETHMIGADDKALEIGGFARRYPIPRVDRVSKRDFIGEFGEWAQGCAIAANNVAFDMSFLKAAWYDHFPSEPEPWHYSPIDIKSYAAGVLGLKDIPKTSAIAELLNLAPNPDAHTALADARFAMDVHERAYRRAHLPWSPPRG